MNKTKASLFSSKKWNADTSHFLNNNIIDLCLENQASVFAGITDLYVPHYREMHIYSYTDTINGIKAFNVAYNDVKTSFKYFLKNKKTDKFIAVDKYKSSLPNNLFQPSMKCSLKFLLVIEYF